MGWNPGDVRFTPCRIGTPILLVGPNGPSRKGNLKSGETALFEVRSWERQPMLGQGGGVGVWSQGGSALAGYTLDSGALTGTITHGATAGVQTKGLAAFTLQELQLMQLRWRVRENGLTGPKMSDLDFWFSVPANSPRWQSQTGVQGVWNARFQFPLPSDVTALPAQGADQAVPSTTSGTGMLWENEHLTETFFFGNKVAPVLNILHHGSTDATAGYLFLEASTIMYQLGVLEDASPRMAKYLGRDIVVPGWMSDAELRKDVPPVPIANGLAPAG